MSLRKFSKKIGIKPSEFSNIERGYTPPDDNFMTQLKVILDVSEDNKDWTELVKLYHVPFIMQKMSECGGIFHATKRIQKGEEGYTSEEDDYNTRSATPEECIEITEWLNNIAKEHNKKADEYNNEKQ